MPTRRPRKRASASSPIAEINSPSILAWPASGRSSPANTISSVDLPEPEAPTMPTDSPASMASETPRKIWTRAAPSPKLRSMESSAMAGLGMKGIRYAGAPSYGAMRRFVQAGAAILCLLGAPAWAKTLKLVVLGDSLSAGYGLKAGEGFCDQLEKALRADGFDVSVVNAGVSGDTAEDGLARYDWSVPPDADGLILELGANDMLRAAPVNDAKAALAGILDKAKAANLPALIAGMKAPANLGADYRAQFDATPHAPPPAS